MIHLRINNIRTPFAINIWKESDYKKPLKISTENGRAELFLLQDKLLDDSLGVKLLVHGNLEIYIEKSEDWFIDGMNKKSQDLAERAAKYIFEIYKESMRQAVTYSRMALDLQNLFEMNSSFDDLFQGDFFSSSYVEWEKTKGNFEKFSFRISRTNERHPVFQDDKLLSPKKWLELQEFIDKNPVPPKEIEELLRLKQKTAWNEKRIAAIESATIIEFILRKKVEGVLTAQGVSHNKIKDIKKDLGMSILLNLLIPLSISKKEYDTQRSNIEKVDKLRKVRNEIIHDGLAEESVDSETVAQGIESAIALIFFLNTKFPNAS